MSYARSDVDEDELSSLREDSLTSKVGPAGEENVNAA